MPQNHQEAIKWFQKAADQGYADAQSNLGACYDNGNGVAQDYQEAVKWYRRAADQGIAIAQFNLGLCYATGKGVPQDYVQAHKWANLSAASGKPGATELRSDLGELMTREQIAEAQRLASEFVAKKIGAAPNPPSGTEPKL